jgi:preprotein translocase SecF subunit
VRGLNLGIDFSGGILLDVKSSEKIDLNKMRADLSGYSPDLQEVGKDGDMASIRLNVQSEEKQTQIINEIKAKLGDKFEFRNVQVVGPKVGDEIIWKGIWAIILSMLSIAIYIWFRFDFAFGVGAIASLVHDIILTFGFLSFFSVDFSLTTVAAILTIIGYSVNDTVVSYDRVRENLKKYRTMKRLDIINLSTNETLTRTILTSLTTFIAVVSIFIFGGAVLRSFSAAMLFGILIGTYSSIFIAMPALLYFNLDKDNQRG